RRRLVAASPCFCEDMIQAETSRLEHAFLKAVRLSVESHLAALKGQLALEYCKRIAHPIALSAACSTAEPLPQAMSPSRLECLRCPKSRSAAAPKCRPKA